MAEKTQILFLWKQIRDKAEGIIPPVSFNTFIKDLEPVDIANRRLLLKAPTDLAANTIMKKHAVSLRDAAGVTEHAYAEPKQINGASRGERRHESRAARENPACPEGDSEHHNRVSGHEAGHSRHHAAAFQAGCDAECPVRTGRKDEQKGNAPERANYREIHMMPPLPRKKSALCLMGGIICRMSRNVLPNFHSFGTYFRRF